MNIVTPIPLAVPFSNANLNTESVRRENQLKEVIPQPAPNEESAANSSLGSESDKVRQPGQALQQLVYERPQISQNPSQATLANDQQQDNGNDPSGGKQNAEDKQQQQAEQRQIEQLEARDREVKTHEQAHARVGGEYAGPPKYEYELGPDGKRYAVGGEVSIDISEESDPEDTLRKMEQVKAAAMAPAEPSAADLRVAAEATQKAAQARSEISQQQQRSQTDTLASEGSDKITELDDIVAKDALSPPIRSLDTSLAETGERTARLQSTETATVAINQPDESRDPTITQRSMRVSDFYARIGQPDANGLDLSA